MDTVQQTVEEIDEASFLKVFQEIRQELRIMRVLLAAWKHDMLRYHYKEP